MSFQKTLEASQEWARILHCSYVTDLNEIVENGNIGEFRRLFTKSVLPILPMRLSERLLLGGWC